MPLGTQYGTQRPIENRSITFRTWPLRWVASATAERHGEHVPILHFYPYRVPKGTAPRDPLIVTFTRTTMTTKELFAPIPGYQKNAPLGAAYGEKQQRKIFKACR